MNFFNKIEKGLEKILVPVSNKLGQNDVIRAISAGMILFLPITLAGAVFTLLANFPIPSISEYFSSVGLEPIFSNIVNATLNVLSLYISFAIAYRYATIKGKNGIVAGLFSIGAFLSLMPQTIQNGEEVIIGFKQSYLGSSGIFVAIISSILISMLYVRLVKTDKLIIKFPDSVPPMVSQSFEPMLIGIIIFLFIAVFQFLLSLVTTTNIFDLVNQFVATPIMKLGASPLTFILVPFLSALLFFLGIHPVSVMSALTPVIMALLTGAIEQFQNGEPIEYLATLSAYAGASVGGVGQTLSLILIMVIFSKSDQYREFSKITIIPGLFNVNEPVIFGLPLMLNPILFVPFVLTSVVGPLLCLFAVKIGFLTFINPVMMLALPFTFPAFFGHFLIGGWQYLLITIIVFLINACIYYPFFLILDKKALQTERELDN